MTNILASLVFQNTSVTGTQTHGDVYIMLTDPATGLPTNGGGLFVEVQYNINGAIFINTQQVIGQSIIIYSGLLQDTSNGYFTIFTVLQVDSGVPDIGNPQACDVSIQNIVIVQSESAPGANDAVISVNGYSSYQPLQYSLDNITYQPSKVFSNLSGGVKTVYVQDSNPNGICTTHTTVTIPILTNLLISDPGVPINTNTSRWNAAFNPINFKYQRKDFEVASASLYNTGGVTGTTLAINGDVSILAGLVAQNVIAGANATILYVYVNAGPYKGVFVVIDCAATTVSIKATFTTTATGYLNSSNIRPYYKIITNIQYNDPVTGQPLLVQSFNRPNTNGEITANLSSFLQSLLKAVDKSDYNTINYRDINLSTSYRISYAESWDDGTVNGYTSVFIDLPDTYYVVYAAKQLGQKYGGNLGQFVPFKNTSAKFLSDFETPVYSLTFPFDIGFIYGEDLAGLQLYFKIIPLDINKNQLNANEIITSFLLNEDGSYILNTDGTRLIISETDPTNIPIVEHVGLNRLLIDFSFDPNVYYFTIGIYYNDISDNPIQVLSDQLVRVDKNLDYNSVYLRWIGLSGSWNYYRFIYNQEITLDVQNSTIIERYVSDWENQESIEDVISKSAGQKIKVMAEDMTVSEIQGCQSMKYSPKVQMLVNKSPIKWKTVVVNTATFAETETNLGEYQFAVTFNLPSVNIQTQ